mmetsp:Transcript_20624/g.43889  ORF Transcript_20624/g.43889 Transcript_20624/m.43889 type:complete len:83 (+) Transcript_20624:3-251(+)
MSREFPLPLGAEASLTQGAQESAGVESPIATNAITICSTADANSSSAHLASPGSGAGTKPKAAQNPCQCCGRNCSCRGTGFL